MSILQGFKVKVKENVKRQGDSWRVCIMKTVGQGWEKNTNLKYGKKTQRILEQRSFDIRYMVDGKTVSIPVSQEPNMAPPPQGRSIDHGHDTREIKP
jgi:hypothetical protein